MRGLTAQRRLAGGLALLSLCAANCQSAAVEPSGERVMRLRLATGPPGGGFLPLGEELVSAFSKRMSQVEISPLPSAGAVANINAIHQGTAELAFTFADVAYLAFSGKLARNQPPFDQLRGIAVLQVAPIALVVRPGLAIRSPSDLRGRSVGVGPEGSGTAVTAGLLLQAFGLTAKDVRVETSGFQEAATKLLNGTLDAMFDNAINPAESLKRVADAGASFVPIEGPGADRVRRDYPFLTATVISRELYGTSVHTIGVDGLLICRSDLDEALVYELTKQLFLSLKSLGRGALRLMDVDQAPATPIPLHTGAARYYRERELSR
jgi:uncharacterized protein